MPSKHSERRQRTVLVAVRLLPSEYATLAGAAPATGPGGKPNISEFIRSSALEAAAAKEKS